MGVKGKYLKLLRLSLLGTGIVFAGGITFFTTDFLAGKFIERYRPQLEKQLSKSLGHPLLIGQYKGLRPWGVSLGYTKLLPGYKDQSTLEASKVNVQIAPISSFFRRRPTLILTLDEALLNLKRNEKGAYWEFGSSNVNNTTNLELLIRLNDPARIFVEPANLLVNAKVRLNLNIANKSAKGLLVFKLPKDGSLTLDGRGNWNKLDFQAKANLDRFKLKSLESFIPSQLNLKTNGMANGEFLLGMKVGEFKCVGEFQVSDLNLIGGPLKDALTAEKVGVNCNNDYLRMPLSKFRYGLWQGTLSGDIPFQDPDNLRLSFSTLFGLPNKNALLNLEAILPFRLDNKNITLGSLSANYKIDSYPLTSLSSVIENSISGSLSAQGTIRGPLSSLTTDFTFDLDNPQFTSLRLQEKWRGRFLGALEGGGELRMESTGAALPSTISATFSDDWRLEDLLAKRLGGEISVNREPTRYKWSATNFRLDRIEVAIPPEKSFKRIFGQLSGEGGIVFNPFLIDGKFLLGYPRLVGIKLREMQLEGSYSGTNYSLVGELFPLDKGQISMQTEGRLGGPISLKTKLNKVSPSWLIKSALQLPKVNVETPSPKGRAEDLGKLAIKPNEASLDSQIREWVRSVIAISRNNQRLNKKEIVDPNLLRGHVDAVIEIQGSDLSNLEMDLKASGEIWPKNSDKGDIKPFTATINGPLLLGNGEFTLVNIPFSLLSLFVPSPSGLSGMFGLTGKYRVGKGQPEVTADLIFNKVGLGDNLVVLNRGNISFSESILKLDLAVQNVNSSNPVTLIGQIPLAPNLPIELRVESHGDGISFLDELFDGTLVWKKGSADLRLLITGTIADPNANGFLVLKNGEVVFNRSEIKELNGIMLFDFNRVEVQRITAKIGDKGRINGRGAIALFRSNKTEDTPLSIRATNVRFNSLSSEVEITSSLQLRGSLAKPIIGGDVMVSKGSISTQRKSTSNQFQLNGKSNLTANKSSLINSLPEQTWNMREPLTLFIRDENAPSSKMLKSAIPTGFSNISFDNLRLNLGPSLRIVSPPVTSFSADGSLILNGSFDQSLNASGLLRLSNGRVNLFTTTFTLDRREPNVAIFVPSMGLIPYVDVKLITRVPDTLRKPNELSSSRDFVTNGSAAFGIGGSRFIKVQVIATGPADRLGDNYQLRSIPAVPENELLGLIGGNSLANLFEGRDSTVFADVLSRSIVTPALANLTGSLSERLQIALYPAYVNTATSEPETVDNQSSSNAKVSSDELSSEQAWVTEIGIDLTDRITFSVQSTPNREDIPAQGNLTLQLNQNFGLLGSFDENGNWQSQLEIFLRY
tara:strand:+ start:37 stop:4002 length:3966 start_codon:yes stop_codon:yes gene_type:complete